MTWWRCRDEARWVTCRVRARRTPDRPARIGRHATRRDRPLLNPRSSQYEAILLRPFPREDRPQLWLAQVSTYRTPATRDLLSSTRHLLTQPPCRAPTDRIGHGGYSRDDLVFPSPQGKALRRTHVRSRCWMRAVRASVREPCPSTRCVTHTPHSSSSKASTPRPSKPGSDMPTFEPHSSCMGICSRDTTRPPPRQWTPRSRARRGQRQSATWFPSTARHRNPLLGRGFSVVGVGGLEPPPLPCKGKVARSADQRRNLKGRVWNGLSPVVAIDSRRSALSCGRDVDAREDQHHFGSCLPEPTGRPPCLRAR